MTLAYPTVDYAYLTGIMPELAPMPSAVVDALNPVAQLYVSPAVFQQATQYALALAIAHIWTLGQIKAGAGPVTDSKIGQLGRSNAALAVDKGAMAMTTYGQRLRDLGRMMGSTMLWVGGQPGPVPPFGGPQPTWTDAPPWVPPPRF